MKIRRAPFPYPDQKDLIPLRLLAFNYCSVFLNTIETGFFVDSFLPKLNEEVSFQNNEHNIRAITDISLTDDTLKLSHLFLLQALSALGKLTEDSQVKITLTEWLTELTQINESQSMSVSDKTERLKELFFRHGQLIENQLATPNLSGYSFLILTIQKTLTP